MNKIHEWINTVLIVAVLILVLVGSNQSDRFGAAGTRFPRGLSTDATSPSSGEVRTTSLTVTAASTLTGTSTVTQSVDGLIVGGVVNTPATTSVSAVYTNTTGPKHCDSSIGYLRQVLDGVWSPALDVGVGTSTSGTLSRLNLLATTTMASTTAQTVGLVESEFDLAQGETIVITFGDTFAGNSSSTHFGALDYEVGVWCQDSSI